MIGKLNKPGYQAYQMAGRRGTVLLAMALFMAMLWGSVPVLAQEYIRDQEPVPDSVDQVITPMELSFQETTQNLRDSFPGLKKS